MADGVLPDPLADTLLQTIYVAYPASSAPSVRGDRTYDTPFAAQAWVQVKDTVTWNGSREVKVSDTRVCTQTELKPDTRIWLPGDDHTDDSKAGFPRGPVRRMMDPLGAVNSDAVWAYVAYL